jgi:hypothetical protein
MHRAIAVWLTGHPWRAAFASALCGALSPSVPLPFLIVAAAIAVLVALRFDLRYAVGMAFVAGATASWVVLSVTVIASGWLALLVLAGIVLFLGPVILAWLLRTTGSMNLTFQVAMLSVALLLVVLFVVLPDPVGMMREQMELQLNAMARAGFKFEGDLHEVAAVWARTMWGSLAALLLGVVFGAVLLGRWWQSLLDSPGSFGVEYRHLRLGAALGVATTAVFITAFMTGSALAVSLASVAFFALAFQGLAAAHRSKAVGRLDRNWLVAIYVLLIVLPVTSFAVLMLAIWGFVDNWLRPRTQSV